MLQLMRSLYRLAQTFPTMSDKTFLILGGAGLVGLQIARRITSDLSPQRIVIASLFEREVVEALNTLNSMYPDEGVEFIGVWGDLFVRSEFTNLSRRQLLQNPAQRKKMYADMLGPIGDAYEQSRLVALIQEHKPDVIVDAINTATAISYQNVYTASRTAKQSLDALFDCVDQTDGVGASEIKDSEYGELSRTAETAFDILLLSQAVPQLVRHVILINNAMRAVGTRLYLKIGTTGTGGMGLNIPYTHGEDKPSATLLSKTAMGFAHTGLLFLMARTVGGPIVKELKPAAMIGYADVAYRPINERGQPVMIYTSRVDDLEDSLELRSCRDDFEQMGALMLPVVDTGENGLFTRGEFEAITALRQMEFITPEEIASKAVLEISGGSSGNNIISALDAAVMDATYRAGNLRQQAIDELTFLEGNTDTYSVAIGQLGPPQLSKLLWEAELMRIGYGTLREVLKERPAVIAERLGDHIRNNKRLRRTIVSTGVPVLLPDGKRLLRGPFIRIPETTESDPPIISLADGDIDKWAKRGWVDLRPSNFERWKTRFEAMVASQKRFRMRGSAAITREAYLFNDIRAGTIAGWIFSNEQDGYRMK